MVYIIHIHYSFKSYYPLFRVLYQTVQPQQTQVLFGDVPRGVEGTDEGVEGGVMLAEESSL
jgi:hypothetical protein